MALDVNDFWSHRQPVEHEVAQAVHVGKPDVDEEVVASGHVEDLDHFGKPEGVLPERVDVRARMRSDADGHDRVLPAMQRQR
jgi:hypothetical protein